MFVDETLGDRLDEIVGSAHPLRPTLLVAQTSDLARELNRILSNSGTAGNKIRVADAERFGGVNPVTGAWELAVLERHLKENPNYYPEMARVFRLKGSVNVFLSQTGPDINFESLESSSIFMKEGTIFILMNQVLRILKAARAPDVVANFRGATRALKAA